MTSPKPSRVAIISTEGAPEGVAGSPEATRLGIVLVLVSAVCFGVDGVIAKVGFAEGTPVFVAVAVKLLAGGTGFFLYLLWRFVRAHERMADALESDEGGRGPNRAE